MEAGVRGEATTLVQKHVEGEPKHDQEPVLILLRLMAAIVAAEALQILWHAMSRIVQVGHITLT